MEKNSKNQNQSMAAQSQQNTVQHNAYQDQRNPGQNQTYAGQNQPYAGQNQPNAGQYQPYAGQYQPNAGQNPSYAGQNQPNAGQHQPYAGQYQPNAGQYQSNAGQYQPNAGQYQPYAGQYQQNLGQYQQYAGQYQQKSGQYQQNLGQNQQNLGQVQKSAEQNQHNRKRSKIFQPKIIIGSICGFIASVIGLIAVFFPTLFDLEKNKIAELNMSIESPSDASNLYKFLLKNENKVVLLKLQYTPKYESVPFSMIDESIGNTETFNLIKKEFELLAESRTSNHYVVDYNMDELIFKCPFFLSMPASSSGIAMYTEKRDKTVIFGEGNNFFVDAKFEWGYNGSISTFDSGSLTFLLDGSNKPLDVGTVDYKCDGSIYRIKYLQKKGLDKKIYSTDMDNASRFEEKYVISDDDFTKVLKNSFEIKINISSNNQSLYKWCESPSDANVVEIKGYFLVKPQTDNEHCSHNTWLSGNQRINLTPYTNRLDLISNSITLEPIDPKNLVLFNTK